MSLFAWQIKAIEAASLRAGEYLDKLGKTDLATLERDEWMGLIEAICVAYEKSHHEQSEPPF